MPRLECRRYGSATSNATEFYELRSEEYIETGSSRFFPILTNAVLTKFIDQSHSGGHMRALVSFRSWVRKTLER
jgi:hypothetical protein